MRGCLTGCASAAAPNGNIHKCNSTLDDGRRQLQALVRLRTNNRGSGFTRLPQLRSPLSASLIIAAPVWAARNHARISPAAPRPAPHETVIYLTVGNVR